jgi:hypothetical protein
MVGEGRHVQRLADAALGDDRDGVAPETAALAESCGRPAQSCFSLTMNCSS